MTWGRRTTVPVLAILLSLTTAGCGSSPPQSLASAISASSSPGPSDGVSLTDLSVIGCARDEPADVGELTGAWNGNDNGVYYIRQVGDCVWWFGTEVDEIEPGVTAQRGFANVASGRMVGTQVDLEWADVPLGDTVNAGGLTFRYDEERGVLTLLEQRGGVLAFGGTTLTRIQPDATASATPSPTATR